MNICNCIIVTDKEHKNMVLAHVDGNHTNLLDKDHGLLSWIEQIPGKDVEIYYGRKMFKKMNNNVLVGLNQQKAKLYNDIYEEQINYTANLARTLGKNVELCEYLDEVTTYHDSVGDCTCTNGAIIHRNNDTIDYGDNDMAVISDEIYYNKFEFPENFTALLSTQFLQNIQVLKDYNSNLENFRNQEFLRNQWLLFQLTYKIYGNQVIGLNNPEFITENMPLPPVCCYNGIGQPKKFENPWKCLNNRKYKNNIKAKIKKYARTIKNIYREHGNIENDDVVENFKKNQKYNLLGLSEKLTFLNDFFRKLLRTENNRQNNDNI